MLKLLVFYLLRGKIRHAMAIPRTQSIAEVALPIQYQWRSRAADSHNIDDAANFQTYAPNIDLDTTDAATFVSDAQATEPSDAVDVAPPPGAAAANATTPAAGAAAGHCRLAGGISVL